MISVAVVTPWLDCPELRDEYWRAMSVLTEDDRVCIIDNNSADPVHSDDTVIVNKTNEGFSRASNQGLHWAAEVAETDAVLFLNNDVQQTSANWLENIRAALRPGRLVGARLRTDWHTRVDGRLFPYLDGWCLAGMTDDWLALGGWDETLEEPSYYGDSLLSFRAKQAGMKLVTVDVGLKHLENHTSKRLDVSGLSQRNYERYAAYVRESLKVLA